MRYREGDHNTMCGKDITIYYPVRNGKIKSYMEEIQLDIEFN